MADTMYLRMVVEQYVPRVLVLTNPAFFEIFERKTRGALTDGVEIECIPLPNDIQAEVDVIVRQASAEVSPTEAVATEVEEEVT